MRIGERELDAACQRFIQRLANLGAPMCRNQRAIVGRGTFISGVSRRGTAAPGEPRGVRIDLEFNYPMLPNQAALVARSLDGLEKPAALDAALGPATSGGTPAVRSVAAAHLSQGAWLPSPDLLVFAGSERILRGNPDIDRVLTMPERPSGAQTLRLLAQLWRRYDLAVSTQSGDRPTFYAWAAGRRSVGFVAGNTVTAQLKRFLLTDSVAIEPGTHRVLEVLALAAPLGIAPVAEVVAPHAAGASVTPARPYAVIHAAPMFRYKRWTDAGWRALADALNERGFAVVATGAPEDKPALDALWAGQADIERLDGTLAWPELGALIGAASVYVGPDTSVTHLAAATGVPTVALFGPTDPALLGPERTFVSGGLGAVNASGGLNVAAEKALGGGPEWSLTGSMQFFM